jgi:hypothetical protein
MEKLWGLLIRRMEQLVNIKGLWILFLIFRSLNLAFANSCEGKGTVFFFGNGMFTTKESARMSRDRLEESINYGVSLGTSKDIQYDIAYKTNESILIQILNVAAHKEIDNWESFWLWLSSLKQPPKWFQDKILLVAAEALKIGTVAFEDIQDHFETYSRYIRQGYNVILVSHSQGNFYANQAMRKLPPYADSSLTGSLLDKRKNPFFPKFFDIFANVQVATPVLATINLSPWSTYKDDLVILLVREKLGGVLPANLKTSGIGFPPDGDLLGHFFVEAYLRNPEARGKILSDIQAQYNKLKYPIVYFQKAVLLEYRWHHYGKENNLSTPDANLFFKILSESRKDIGSSREERPNPNEIVEQSFADCNDLPQGTSKIFLDVDSDEKKEVSFEVWPTGNKENEKPTLVSFQVKKGFSSWEVGMIHTEEGLGKEPLLVKTEIYPQPKPRLSGERK